MPGRPNVLLLITDNQRLDTVSALGMTPCRTPTWDRMAAQGVLLDHMRTTSPICSPARASLFTGLHPHQAGMPTVGFTYAQSNDGTGVQTAPRLACDAFPGFLRSEGYQTLYAGKWHVGDSIGSWFDAAVACDQADRDYSEWCRHEGVPDGFIFHDPQRSKPYRSRIPPGMSLPATGVLDIPEDKEHNHWVLGHALETFALRDPDRPFFMTLSLEGPHPPLVVPERYYDMYDPSGIPEPENWGPNPREPSFLADCYYRRLRREWSDDFDAWRKSVAVYWGYATYVDSLLGRFLDRLAEVGVLDDTLVVMVSDHGDMMGQHAMTQKMCPYEEAVRVPCVIRWPGAIRPGTRCGADASLIDLAPTILAACGLHDVTSPGMEGRNLLPLLQGEEDRQAQPRDCFMQYDMSDFQREWQGIADWRAIVRRPWKYVLHEDGQQELFHLEDDPRETDNRADNRDAQSTRTELREALLRWVEQTGDVFAPPDCASRRSA